ncbi:ABC transporter substrate-binding protein [Comamonas sp. SCN 65-56]|uniref:ABC transporter substrate-binding protein n=1 Tax=Comamonas sp. SCN 65-56 TaxID=1660095 RepID=UPI0025BE9144|nr:ABC transporter substrate-binding protein [Comamonas sp. SCN 65-56]
MTESAKMKGMRRRRWLASAAAMAALGMGQVPLAHAAPARRAKLTLAGPFALVSYPLMRIADSGALADVADKVEFTTWKSPDQLRAMAIGDAVDLMAMPSNVAANLYNRGVPLKLLDITTWGLLWMVSRDQGLRTLADFRGKEVVMPFRGDMPDIVFQLLAEKQGIKVGSDIKLRYVASPIDAMQLLITRRADHALLAEPAVSMGLRKTHSFPVKVIAPDLYRSVDLQQEWGRVFKRPPRIAQAGVAALKGVCEDAALLVRFEQEHAKALKWCQEHPEPCGAMAARHVEMLTPEGVAGALAATRDTMAWVGAAQARPDLEFFYQQLLERQPGLVGGKLPDAGFYG